LLKQTKKGSDDAEDDYAKACYYIEKILHTPITGDYPASKFLEVIYQMNKDPEYKPKKSGVKVQTIG